MNETTYNIIVNNVGWSYANYMLPDSAFTKDGVPTIELGDGDLALVHEIARGVYYMMVAAGFVNE